MADDSTRQRIIEAADRLFYQQGYEYTSFAMIASAVGISRGNFYHHFRTKDDILQAVIERRLAGTRRLLDQWELDGGSPVERIRSFIHILVANQAKIKLYGCPVGTLCTELAKLENDLLGKAGDVFTLFRDWLKRQFALLGRSDADQLALHLLARSQGVATLANTFHDEQFIKYEVQQMCDWLQALTDGEEPDGSRDG